MTTHNNTQVKTQRVNGVKVERVMEIIESVEAEPDNAQFQFRLNNRWVEGGQNSSRIKGYYADGYEDESRTEPFIVHADEPSITAGGDSAPNPMEYVLHSLASCLTSTMVYHAAVQDIEIESAESSLEGDMDVRGMLGLSEQTRKGFHHVRVRMRVKSTASAETLKELAMFSPVYDIVSRALPVELVLEKF
jgi:uncharacterized OsmC-like protein